MHSDEEHIFNTAHQINNEERNTTGIPLVEELKKKEVSTNFQLHYAIVIQAILLEAANDKIPFSNLLDMYIGIQVEQNNYFETWKLDLKRQDNLFSLKVQPFLDSISTIYPYVYDNDIATQSEHFGSRHAMNSLSKSIFKEYTPYLFGLILEATLHNRILFPLYKLKHDLEVINKKHPGSKIEITDQELINKIHSQLETSESNLILATGLGNALQNERIQISERLGNEMLIYLESFVALPVDQMNRSDFKNSLLKLLESNQLQNYCEKLILFEKDVGLVLTEKVRYILAERITVLLEKKQVTKTQENIDLPMLINNKAENVEYIEKTLLNKELDRSSAHEFGSVDITVYRPKKFKDNYVLHISDGKIFIPEDLPDEVKNLDRIFEQNKNGNPTKKKASRFIIVKVGSTREINNLTAEETLFIIGANNLRFKDVR